MKLDGKTALVTGGASGIGRATTLALARAGARVFIGDIDEKGGNELASEARSEQLQVEYRRVDLTDGASIDTFAAQLLAEVERIDVLVNGAGWGRTEPFVNNSPEFWDRVMSINLMGPIRLTRRLIQPMFDARSGRIVNVSSDAGRVGSLGETVYSAAKGGVIGFTKALARESARYSVHVNCVCPGPTNTPLLQAVPDKIRDAFTRAIPFRRIAEPHEVANAILFFASPRSEYITGQVLSVSGGLTMAG